MKRGSQAGVALILALMVFAIVSATAINALMSTHHSLTVADFAQRQAQQKQTLLGGEAWAQAWFSRYHRANVENMEPGVMTDWQRPWQLVDQRFPLSEEPDAAQLHIQIIERQACININELANDEGREITRLRLQQLAQKLGESGNWVDPLTDWIDGDQDLSGTNGQEDEYYIGLEPHYRTADSAVASFSELPLLSLDKSLLHHIAPYICTLPQALGVNINRANEVILGAMIPSLTSSQMDMLMARIKTSGFASLDNFLSLEMFDDQSLVREDWRLDSRFVEVFVTLEQSGQERRLHTVLWKDDGGRVAPWFRSFGPFDAISKTLLIQSQTE